MTQLNILNRLTKHKAVCACSRCAASYTCNTYDAVKARKEAELKYGFHENHGT